MNSWVTTKHRWVDKVKLTHIFTKSNKSRNLAKRERYIEQHFKKKAFITFGVQGSGSIQVEVPAEKGGKVRGHRNPSH